MHDMDVMAALQSRIQVSQVSDLGPVTEKTHSTSTQTEPGPEISVCVSLSCSGR